MLFIRKMKTFLNLIPGLSHDTTLSLSLAAFSFMIYLSNFRIIGSGDTVPASLLPITLLTEGSIYFDSYAQHYEKNGNPVYFFHHTRGRTVSSYPLATGFLASYAHLRHSGIGVENHPRPHTARFISYFSSSFVLL